ncbi:hypothetical protein OGH69_01170 [Flavobacterium sp. MFBS3-15]|uniref:hypothetical protein n=1 Tax=Flavobacterium sp. MFBS3-15 TaxID=2989816 RepID=UPI002235C2CD|nr:hypothetical protein [Flavobacterium sp. MFBS3-15]MCW4467566.1 hypothetical protein [Flavobacterium sp. MFBS3-15]
MTKYLSIPIFLFFNLSIGQTIVEEKIFDEKSGINFIEVDRVYKQFKNVKDVFIILSYKEEEQSAIIKKVKKYVLQKDIKYSVFYFWILDSKLPGNDKNEMFRDLTLTVLQRKKMPESNLYLITPEDITDIYDKYVNDYDIRGGDYANPIRDILLSNNLEKVIDFIAKKYGKK